MFDFNHGAMREATDPRALPFSDRVNAAIDAGVSEQEAEIRKNEVRKYIGASAIGRTCLRRIQLDYLAATVPSFTYRPKLHESKLLKIFNNGHRIEPMVADWMRKGGFDICTEKPDGKQYGFRVDKIDFAGHFDGIIRHSPFPMELHALWECKGLKSSSWKKFKKNGVKLESQMYYAQIQVNQMHSGLTAPCVFTIYNKDTSELHHELVEHNREHAERMTQNAAIIHKATKTGRLLKRPFNDPKNYKCRMCEWKKSCWALKR